jgi:hypothetical protein
MYLTPTAACSMKWGKPFWIFGVHSCTTQYQWLHNSSISPEGSSMQWTALFVILKIHVLLLSKQQPNLLNSSREDCFNERRLEQTNYMEPNNKLVKQCATGQMAMYIVQVRYQLICEAKQCSVHLRNIFIVQCKSFYMYLKSEKKLPLPTIAGSPYFSTYLQCLIELLSY